MRMFSEGTNGRRTPSPAPPATPRHRTHSPDPEPRRRTHGRDRQEEVAEAVREEERVTEYVNQCPTPKGRNQPGPESEFGHYPDDNPSDELFGNGRTRNYGHGAIVHDGYRYGAGLAHRGGGLGGLGGVGDHPNRGPATRPHIPMFTLGAQRWRDLERDRRNRQNGGGRD